MGLMDMKRLLSTREGRGPTTSVGRSIFQLSRNSDAARALLMYSIGHEEDMLPATFDHFE